LKLIGITGGIATGKSTVAKLIQNSGHPVIDADLIGHKALEKESIKQRVIKELGDVLNNYGMIDRKKLGALVFENPKKLRILNNILHPEMIRMILEMSKKLGELSKEVFVEAAVLFEMKLDKYTDFIVITDCPDELRVERLMKRDHLSFEEAKKRITLQLSRDEFLKRADWVIDTSRNIENTLEQVFKMLKLRPWSAKI